MTARPRVRLHFAQSLDGRIGLAGVRTPLSSRRGFELAHRARAEHDAVLVGRATVQIDDPRLVAHECDRRGAADETDRRQPRRIVLASGLDVASNARILCDGPGTLIIGVRGRASAASRARLIEAGARVELVAPGDDGLVSLREALAVVRDWGVGSLLVEGGGCVISSFLRHRLADEATIEIVPRLLGAPAIAAVGASGVDELCRAIALEEPSVERAEESIVIRGRLAY